MTPTASVFLFAAFALAIGYLVYEHRRISQPINPKPTPDMFDTPVSASANPGDLVGPGATSNTGWYTLPPPRYIPGV